MKNKGNYVMIKASNYDIDGSGNKFITPIEKRAKRSKFAKIISRLSDKDIKALTYCLLDKPDVKYAIDCYSRAVEHDVQLYALKEELKGRISNEK